MKTTFTEDDIALALNTFLAIKGYSFEKLRFKSISGKGLYCEIEGVELADYNLHTIMDFVQDCGNFKIEEDNKYE